MKIQKIKSQNFERKQHFLSVDGTMNMQKLLGKMNNETVYTSTGKTFESKVLRKINVENKARFTDKRFLVDKSNNVYGESTLTFDNTELAIDNTSGEITNYKKPFFKSWKNIISKAEEIISTAVNNFDNNNIVKKNFIKISGFTLEGAKNLRKVIKNVENKN